MARDLKTGMPAGLRAIAVALGVATFVAVTLFVLRPGPAKAVGVTETAADVIVAREQVVEDVSLVDGNVLVRGTVREDVRVLNGNVEIARGGLVRGDVALGNGEIRVASGGRIAGNAFLGNGDITVAARGAVGGDARVARGEIDAPVGVIGGERSTGPSFLNADPFGKIDFGFAGWVLFTVLAVITGAIFSALFPGAFRAIGNRLLNRAWVPAVVGILGVIWVPLTVVLLVLTVFGIIYLPFWLPFLVAAAVAGWLGAAYLVGALILKLREPGRGEVIGATVLGVAILRAIDLIPIAGSIINALVALVAFGAVTLLVIEGIGRSGGGGRGVLPTPEKRVPPSAPVPPAPID